jgi:hypothetical protein
MSRDIDYIIFHCSDSNWGDVDVIRGWHKVRGWRDVGYNAVILNGSRGLGEYSPDDDGLIEQGRGLDFSAQIESNEQGAHVLGYNGRAVGICLIGRDKFTLKQFHSAIAIARVFKKICPNVLVAGHNEMPTAGGKTCPNFDMGAFRHLLLDSVNNDTDALNNRMREFIA